MKQMLNFLGKSAMTALKNGIEEVKTIVNEFDIDKAKADLLIKGEEIKVEFHKLMERVRNYTDKFEVDIPFNQETEIFTYKWEENMIQLKVDSVDGTKTQTTDVRIPEDVDTNKISQKYDAEKKILTLVIGKKF